MGNVAKLGSVRVDKNDKPVDPNIKIHSCDVDDHGVKWY
jgi:hypothetical protein